MLAVPESRRDPVRRPDRRHGLLVGEPGRASRIAEQVAVESKGWPSSTIRQAAQNSPWLRAPSGRDATQAASLSGRDPIAGSEVGGRVGRGGSRNARRAAASTGVARCWATVISSYDPPVDPGWRGDDVAAVASEVDVLAGHLPRPLLRRQGRGGSRRGRRPRGCGPARPSPRRTRPTVARSKAANPLPPAWTSTSTTSTPDGRAGRHPDVGVGPAVPPAPDGRRGRCWRRGSRGWSAGCLPPGAQGKTGMSPVASIVEAVARSGASDKEMGSCGFHREVRDCGCAVLFIPSTLRRGGHQVSPTGE